jgi:hypothetical protein
MPGSFDRGDRAMPTEYEFDDVADYVCHRGRFNKLMRLYNPLPRTRGDYWPDKYPLIIRPDARPNWTIREVGLWWYARNPGPIAIRDDKIGVWATNCYITAPFLVGDYDGCMLSKRKDIMTFRYLENAMMAADRYWPMEAEQSGNDIDATKEIGQHKAQVRIEVINALSMAGLPRRMSANVFAAMVKEQIPHVKISY